MVIAPYDLPELQSWTAFWRKRYDWLLSSGLEIRPEYRSSPAATAVGKRNKKLEEELESEYQERSLKAVRTADGQVMSLSLIEKAKEAVKVVGAHALGFFLQFPDHPRNHCAPLSILPDPYNTAFLIFITPCLGKHLDRRFESVGELMDFFRQLLEGFHFLHGLGVCRIEHTNGRSLFDSFRPLECDLKHRRRYPWDMDSHRTHTRSYTARPVKYLFDVPSNLWIDSTATPEHDQACRLAAVDDIKRLRENMRILNRIYTNLGFLEPLVTRMDAQIEHETPAVQELMEELDKILSQLSRKQLRARVVQTYNIHPSYGKDFTHRWFHALPNRVLRRNPVPTILPKVSSRKRSV